MSIKSLYKRIVPASYRKWVAGLPWVEKRRNRQLVEEGKRLAAEAKAAQKSDGKKRVTFIVQRPALWPNQRSVYEAFKADLAWEVMVVAIPKRPPAAKDYDLAEFQRLMAFLESEKIAYRKGFDLECKTWINPMQFGLPDVVFLPQPYAHTQSYLYHSAYLKQFCRLAIYDYGMQVADMEFMFYLPVYDDCQFIFLESEAHRRLYLERVPRLADKLYVTGHPKMDVYRRALPANMDLWKCPQADKRVIWAPHFTVSNDWTPHTFSNFFKYFEYFVDFAQRHPDVELVMRPHPDLFEHMVAVGLKTRAEADAYRNRFNSLPNGQVYEGSEIFTMFRQSDALILDSISFLAEYLPAGKPICFLDSARRQRLNPMGEKLLHAYYAAWDADEIEDFLVSVVIEGCDFREEERRRAASQYLYWPPESAGEEIKRVVDRYLSSVTAEKPR